METYIFYEIKCRDETITDTYIGSTTNFNNRKKTHKYRCNTEGKGHHTKLYTYIRENGGWDNFTMTEIDRHECINKEDAEAHEQMLIEQKNASLNTRMAHRSQEAKIEQNKILCSAYYEAHRKEQLKKAAEYREANIELLRQRQQEYRDNNRELTNQQARESKARAKAKKLKEQDESI